jgi:radical SAM protein with 4Fe4S-binding SPASM domain
MMDVDANFHTIGGRSVVDRADARYRKYRQKWKEWPETFHAGEFPLHLDVETNSLCNLRCPFCATTHNRYRPGFMEEAIWRKVIDEGGKNGLYSLKFTFRGEPLLHRDLPRMVKYAKDAGILDVYFNTNAVGLTEPAIRSLIDAGLDRISISFEGFEKTTYENYRVGAQFEVVVRNIEALKRIREEVGSSKPLVRIQTVLVPELAGREKEYVAFWTPRVDEVAYLDMKNEDGNPDHRGIIADWACPQLWQRMTITWDGKILPCVHDIYEWMSFGNVRDISIRDAWKSVGEEDYRNRHRTGRAHEIPACDRCPLRENEITKLQRCGGP